MTASAGGIPCIALAAVVIVLTASCSSLAGGALTLSPGDLSAGFNARKVLLRKDGAELGHSMPFCERYRLEVDGAQVESPRSPLAWALKPGRNTLKAWPVDQFGKRGLASSVTLRHTP